MPFMNLTILSLFAAAALTSAQYVPLKHYRGNDFFTEWDFYGAMDNTTWGNVTYADYANATRDNLAYVNQQGHAILKVDNTSVFQPAELVLRPSIRLTTKDFFPVGTIMVLDLVHLPYGCSVWGAFWTLGLRQTGEEWPIGGEIDIIEGINGVANNQVALHSTPGCFREPESLQSGRGLERNCSQDAGCTVLETKPNSYGAGFAQAGGGVYATQFDVSGVYLWFWSRNDIPASIRDATDTSNLNVADWGMPTASYPASACNITNYFTAQQLIFTITMCGAWADAPNIYSQTCPGTCIANVFGSPGNPALANAYFEIASLRTYAAAPANDATPAPTVIRTTTGSPTTAGSTQSTEAPAGAVPSPATTQPGPGNTATSQTTLNGLFLFCVLSLIGSWLAL